MVAEHWQGVTQLIRVEKAKKYLQQNYSTAEEEPPSSDNKDGEEEPESADDGADTDEEESDTLCPVALPQTPPSLELRKPKYITRVRSGYEWNKYNRVHYGHDHPPPKVVKGYKFVVCYPDLAGTKPPEYTVHQDGESDETCIIRFHAGPPYEDIAFRIVNKEWEYSRKAGFKCTFERVVLHPCHPRKITKCRHMLAAICCKQLWMPMLGARGICITLSSLMTVLILLMDLHISYTIVCSEGRPPDQMHVNTTRVRAISSFVC
uniref:Uncharacterized protein n=1 Tax=Avena sativa TaxID=4498 RepID=A0ACD5V421_AVESA